jgi:hypothetical protein
MPREPIVPAQPAPMAQTLVACSRNDEGSRPRAATHERPSGRSRSPRIDRSTITSPTTRSRTQISPGVRGATPNTYQQPRNHSPPPTGSTALLQINRHGERSEPDFRRLATAARAAAATAACRRLAEARLRARAERREHRELAQHVRGAAVRTRRRVGVHADELLEVPLALHACVLVDGHEPILPCARKDGRPRRGPAAC